MKWLASVTTLPPLRVRQLVWMGLGTALIISGILIALTPVVMGVTLLLVGSVILLRNSSDARRLFVRIKRRFPETFRSFDAWRHRRQK
ncbi:MAG: hypothetical protein WCF85_01235 [Rhodospirillaceae bacterium]